jgi:nitric oxide reductase subunit C
MLHDKYKVILMGVLASAFLYYSFTLYASLPVDHPVANNESAKGKLLWQQYNCNSCHQVYGLGGYLGPDLTNVYSRRGSGYITGLLKSGTVTMPDFHLKEAEIKSFLAYFENMDATGKSDPRTFTIKKDGTIIQE